MPDTSRPLRDVRRREVYPRTCDQVAARRGLPLSSATCPASARSLFARRVEFLAAQHEANLRREEAGLEPLDLAMTGPLFADDFSLDGPARAGPLDEDEEEDDDDLMDL